MGEPTPPQSVKNWRHPNPPPSAASHPPKKQSTEHARVVAIFKARSRMAAELTSTGELANISLDSLLQKFHCLRRMLVLGRLRSFLFFYLLPVPFVSLFNATTPHVLVIYTRTHFWGVRICADANFYRAHNRSLSLSRSLLKYLSLSLSVVSSLRYRSDLRSRIHCACLIGSGRSRPKRSGCANAFLSHSSGQQQ